jgi:hypothetical protein
MREIICASCSARAMSSSDGLSDTASDTRRSGGNTSAAPLSSAYSAATYARMARISHSATVRSARRAAFRASSRTVSGMPRTVQRSSALGVSDSMSDTYRGAP